MITTCMCVDLSKKIVSLRRNDKDLQCTVSSIVLPTVNFDRTQHSIYTFLRLIWITLFEVFSVSSKCHRFLYETLSLYKVKFRVLSFAPVIFPDYYGDLNFRPFKYQTSSVLRSPLYYPSLFTSEID